MKNVIPGLAFALGLAGQDVKKATSAEELPQLLRGAQRQDHHQGLRRRRPYRPCRGHARQGRLQSSGRLWNEGLAGEGKTAIRQEGENRRKALKLMR